MTKIVKEDLAYILSNLDATQKEKFKDSTVLVTGCAGFLGYYFMQFLAEYSQELGIKKIIGLDNFMLGTPPKWIETLEADYSNVAIHKFDIITDAIESVEGAEEADMIIHMASIASPVFYRQYPIETLDANIWGLRRLLDFYVKKEIRGFLFFSSSEIYGDPDPDHIPTDEEYPGRVMCTGPRACYDESKRFGETMCMLFAEKYNMPISIARPFNNYGPGMNINDKRVVADFAKSAYEGTDIEIFSDGLPTRTFCYISDAVTGYLKILTYGTYDYFNIGIDKPEITIRDLAKTYQTAAKEVFDNEISVSYQTHEDEEYLTDNPNRRCPVIDKARAKLGYNPTIYVEEGIVRFLNFLKESGGEL